jgi:hypothetical protein
MMKADIECYHSNLRAEQEGAWASYRKGASWQ